MLSTIVKGTKSLQDKFSSKEKDRANEDEDDGEVGANWENNENVQFCRHCDSKFEFVQTLATKRLWKHHCRACGGVYCENCLTKTNDGKICLSCFRGETPGN